MLQVDYIVDAVFHSLCDQDDRPHVEQANQCCKYRRVEIKIIIAVLLKIVELYGLWVAGAYNSSSMHALKRLDRRSNLAISVMSAFPLCTKAINCAMVSNIMYLPLPCSYLDRELNKSKHKENYLNTADAIKLYKMHRQLLYDGGMVPVW